MKSYQIIRAMLEAKVPHDAILVALDAAQKDEKEGLEKRRETDRIRQQKKRERVIGHVMSRDTLTVQRTVPSRARVVNILSSEPKGSSEVIERKEGREETRVTALLSSEFNTFWEIYPNKVGKPKALESFRKARRRADFETIMAGLRSYVSKTDDRPWCNPTTFLNQDRWGDIPAASIPFRQGSPPNEGRRTASHALMEMANGTGKYAGLFEGRNDPNDIGSSGEFPRLISG